MVLRIPLEDIVKATNNFADENLIKRGEFADVYEGRLLRSGEVIIDVIVRRFHPPSSIQMIMKRLFQGEVQALADLKHRNSVSIVGFCDENGEMMMIMERAVNGDLDKHLSDPTLKWSQRLNICLRVAVVLEHIKQTISKNRHHDIKSSNILLDKDWEPKLFCFGFIMDHNVVFYKTTVYTDPEVINIGRIYNANAYSLGVIMFEVLCGRTADESLLSMLKQQQQVKDMIDPNLGKVAMHPRALSIFLKIAYNCLKESQHRSYMSQIVERLSEALKIQSIEEFHNN